MLTLARRATTGIALSLLALSPAFAAPSVEERLAELQRLLSAQQQQLDAQRKLLDDQAAEIASLRGGSPPAEVAQLKKDVQEAKLALQDSAKLTIVGGRPTFASADGRNSISLRSVVQLDTAHYDQKKEGLLTEDFRRGSQGAATIRDTFGARDLSDGTYFRRARLGFEGVFARDFNFRFIGEFGGSGTEGPARINDAWINYTGFAPFIIQLGAFTPSANLEDATSQEELLFPERNTPSELSRTLGGADGRIGASVRGSGTRWFSSLAVTSRTAGDAEVFDAPLNLVGRVGVLALTSLDYNVHVGAAGTWQFRPADLGSTLTPRRPVRFRDRPELRVDSTRLIDTGLIDSEDSYTTSLEFAANWKNFFVQSEYFWYGIDRVDSSTLANPRFDAFYVQGSWVITGEPHRYNMATASFQMPRPYTPAAWRSGWGAWELALRYSHTDLNYRAGDDGTAAPLDAVRGGVQDIWTLGLNWYLNQNFRLSLDYYRVDVDRLNPAGPGNPNPFGAPPATPPVGVEIGQEYNVFNLRSQFNF